MTPASVPSTAPREATAFATCPFCHTEDRGTTTGDLDAGAVWRCGLCDQQWDARRLATMAAHDAWLARRRTCQP
jgi:hypothetical protein